MSLVALLTLSLLAADPAPAPMAPTAPTTPVPHQSDTAGNVLAVRYALVVGGRNGEEVPPGSGVLSQPELTDFLARWNPDRDYEEVRQVFALNDLGEVARQAVLLPERGGQLTGRFSYRDAPYVLKLRVDPALGGVRVQAQIERAGALLSAPSAQLALGDRVILSGGTAEPSLPFVFLVVEIDRADTSELAKGATPSHWGERVPRVDGEAILAPKLVDAKRPPYPEEARKQRVEGVVIMDVLIDEQGAVEDVSLVQGQPLGLSEAAIEAVRGWRFEPATRDGRPIRVEYTLTVNFRLDPKLPAPIGKPKE